MIGVVLLLGVGLAGTGYALVTSGCDGTVTLTVVASPDQAPVLTTLAQRWAATEPSASGRCVQVEVASRDSAQVAAHLSPSWATAQDGKRPDVWMPEASTWLQVAARDPAAGSMLGTHHPSVARSPVVIALPRPMAEALGWPDQQLGLPGLVKALHTPGGWGAFGHAEWGPMRFGIADPARDTAALSAVLAALNYDGDQAVSPTELAAAKELGQLAGPTAPVTTDLLVGIARAAINGAPLSYLSAFPVTERDVIRYNKTNPAVPLAADYPPDGLSSADHPYTVLQAPWVDPLRRNIAGRFLSYLRGPAGRSAFVRDGFRPPGGAATDQTVESQGLLPVGFAERDAPEPQVITAALTSWATLRRDATAGGG